MEVAGSIKRGGLLLPMSAAKAKEWKAKKKEFHKRGHVVVRLHVRGTPKKRK